MAELTTLVSSFECLQRRFDFRSRSQGCHPLIIDGLLTTAIAKGPEEPLMHADLALVDANTSGTRIYYAFDNSTRFNEERSTQIGHVFLRKV